MVRKQRRILDNPQQIGHKPSKTTGKPSPQPSGKGFKLPRGFPVLIINIFVILIVVGLFIFISPHKPMSSNSTGITIEVYRAPDCSCCHEHERYLKKNGFEIKSYVVENPDIQKIKDNLGIPLNMRSCHTTIVNKYYVEGHVPVEAIKKLLEERPAIKGIGLPGMPSGSPGMGGSKRRPFTIYAISNGTIYEFMNL